MTPEDRDTMNEIRADVKALLQAQAEHTARILSLEQTRAGAITAAVTGVCAVLGSAVLWALNYVHLYGDHPK